MNNSIKLTDNNNQHINQIMQDITNLKIQKNSIIAKIAKIDDKINHTILKLEVVDSQTNKLTMAVTEFTKKTLLMPSTLSKIGNEILQKSIAFIFGLLTLFVSIIMYLIIFNNNNINTNIKLLQTSLKDTNTEILNLYKNK